MLKFKVGAKGNSSIPSSTSSAQPAPIAEPETNAVTNAAPLDLEISDHNEIFISHHWIHIIEFAVVALLILIWWLVERRRRV